ncbi:sigma-70 family RNA polymerase sigma factor [Nonomuraea sp. NPDC048882]|uniref:RNA polymerase sigma factor n=1 Tax=Nonomuraea sp. NPDC048882 TaxID=3154347 RepID=UPI0033E37FBA
MVQLNKSAAQAAAPPEADPSIRGQVEQFYRQRSRLLMKATMMHGATVQEAEDVVSMTMLDLWRRWHTILNPHAYAAKALRSNLIKLREKDRAEAGRLLRTQAPAREADWDTRMTLWEDRTWVEQLLDRLPPAQREVMAYYLEGLNCPEIAEYLDKKPATIRKNLQFARERLKEIIEQEHRIQTPVAQAAPQIREEGAQ